MKITLFALLFSTGAWAAETAPSFEVYGFGMGDYIQDFDRVDPAWQDTLRPSRIPTSKGTFGSNGHAVLSARQSRLGAQGSVPAGGNDAFAKVEFDFFGVGPDEGKVTPRLRHAYGEWGAWLGGQTHSLFMDIDVFPNCIDYWGPTGLVFLRNPQLRFTPVKGNTSFAVALERPGNDVDVSRFREIDERLGSNAQADNKVPDLSAQFRTQGDWGHASIGGILRRVGYETLTRQNNDPKGHEVGWGLDLSTKLNVTPYDKLILSVVGGQGIANYMNDGGIDLAPEIKNAAFGAKAVPLMGATGYLEHTWNKLFSSIIGYSRTQIENTNFQGASAYHYGQYASANVLYSPSKDVLFGFEVLWGNRTDNDGSSGDDIRTQVSFKYSFSSKNLAAKL